MNTDPVLSTASRSPRGSGASAEGWRTISCRTKEVEMRSLYSQIEEAVPSSLKGAAIKISTSAIWQTQPAIRSPSGCNNSHAECAAGVPGPSISRTSGHWRIFAERRHALFGSHVSRNRASASPG